MSRNPWTFLCTRKLRRLVSFSLNFVFLLRDLQEVQTNPGNLLNLRNDEGIYLCLIEITGKKTGIRKTSEGITRRSVNTKRARKLGWIGELREGARVMGLGRGTLIQLEGLGWLGLAALRAACFTGFPSALLGGQSKRVARELETSEKGEGVGWGVTEG